MYSARLCFFFFFFPPPVYSSGAHRRISVVVCPNRVIRYPACLGDGSPRASSASLVTYIDRKDITHTDPSGEGPGANM